MVAEALKGHPEILKEFTYIQLRGIIDYEKLKGGMKEWDESNICLIIHVVHFRLLFISNASSLLIRST